MNKRLVFMMTTAAALWCGAAGATDMQMRVTRDAYGETRQTAIRAGDLDLTRSEGATELLARLKYAAVRVCDADSMNWDLSLYELHRACVKSTMDRAVARVPIPLVKQLYAAEYADDQ